MTPRLLAIKLQEDAGIDIVSDGEQSRQHFVHGFLEAVDGIDFDKRVEMGIRNDRYKAMCPTVTGELQLRRRVHQREARLARAHTKQKLKFTLPGPMTIVDTIADAHYGDRMKMALAFAALLNEEVRGLAADGVDVIQFDEPAFNVYMDAGSRLGHRGAASRHRGRCHATAPCTSVTATASPPTSSGKPALGDEWRQYEKFFPALGQKPDRSSLDRMHQFARADERLKLLDGKEVQIGVIDVATDKIETPEEVAARDCRSSRTTSPAQKIIAIDQLRHGADAPRHRREEARSARRRRGAGAQNAWLRIFSAGRAKRRHGSSRAPASP